MPDETTQRRIEDELPVDAVTQVLTALRPLDRETRMRVLAAVSTLLGSSPQATPEPPPVSNLPRSMPVPPQTTMPGFFTEDRTPTAKQFLIEKKPRTDVDRIACLAYYLAHYRQQPQFKTVDLSTLNAEAAQAKFSNAAQTVENATRSGLLLQATNGQKQLSAVGELYVQELPDYDGAKAALTEHRPKRRR